MLRHQKKHCRGIDYTKTNGSPNTKRKQAALQLVQPLTPVVPTEPLQLHDRIQLTADALPEKAGFDLQRKRRKLVAEACSALSSSKCVDEDSSNALADDVERLLGKIDNMDATNAWAMDEIVHHNIAALKNTPRAEGETRIALAAVADVSSAGSIIEEFALDVEQLLDAIDAMDDENVNAMEAVLLSLWARDDKDMVFLPMDERRHERGVRSVAAVRRVARSQTDGRMLAWLRFLDLALAVNHITCDTGADPRFDADLNQQWDQLFNNSAKAEGDDEARKVLLDDLCGPGGCHELEAAFREISVGVDDSHGDEDADENAAAVPPPPQMQQIQRIQQEASAAAAATAADAHLPRPPALPRLLAEEGGRMAAGLLVDENLMLEPFATGTGHSSVAPPLGTLAPALQFAAPAAQRREAAIKAGRVEAATALSLECLETAQRRGDAKLECLALVSAALMLCGQCVTRSILDDPSSSSSTGADPSGSGSGMGSTTAAHCAVLAARYAMCALEMTSEFWRAREEAGDSVAQIVELESDTGSTSTGSGSGSGSGSSSSSSSSSSGTGKGMHTWAYLTDAQLVEYVAGLASGHGRKYCTNWLVITAIAHNIVGMSSWIAAAATSAAEPGSPEVARYMAQSARFLGAARPLTTRGRAASAAALARAVAGAEAGGEAAAVAGLRALARRFDDLETMRALHEQRQVTMLRAAAAAEAAEAEAAGAAVAVGGVEAPKAHGLMLRYIQKLFLRWRGSFLICEELLQAVLWRVREQAKAQQETPLRG